MSGLRTAIGSVLTVSKDVTWIAALCDDGSFDDCINLTSQAGHKVRMYCVYPQRANRNGKERKSDGNSHADWSRAV